ncbi:hypothetical protein NIES4071_26050 [Calothrix sp. NIES-4071]|nr:hypothetical protein NIES4071_26050 [Calothrix sp. NIES-4071]BAZ56927.1 hypothetical protein NIES4105_25990 [Calothrix sp. NIES-4105]
MTLNLSSSTQTTNWRQFGFYAIALLFNLCLVAQVLTVGLAYFYNPEWWNIHVLLVRGYSVLAPIMLLWVFLSSFPQRVRNLTLSISVLLGLQFLTIHLKSPLHAGVLHPLIGFLLFNVSTTLVHRVQHVVFPTDGENNANRIV